MTGMHIHVFGGHVVYESHATRRALVRVRVSCPFNPSVATSMPVLHSRTAFHTRIPRDMRELYIVSAIT